MSLNVTTSSTPQTAATSQVSSSQNSESAKKSSTDSSFKDEMKKVTTKEEKLETPSANTEVKSDQKSSEDKKLASNTKVKAKSTNSDSNQLAEDLKYKTLSMIDVNNNLVNDIENMMNTNSLGNFGNNVFQNLLTPVDDPVFGNLFSLDYTDNVFVSESDAKFFINLTQNNNVTAQAVTAQAQLALENGAELSQVQQNVKISETLLNAINTARENNQPLRIDFDQNIAVILRFGKDGSFAANFIPGDKAVEQYLRNNLESLKSTFDEKDIPYTDLSYSNRGSKHQKEQHRNQQQ